MDGEVYIYPHHGIPHRGVVDPPRTTTLRLRQPTVRTVLGSRIPRLPISLAPLFRSSPSNFLFCTPAFLSLLLLVPAGRCQTVSFHFPFRFPATAATPVHRDVSFFQPAGSMAGIQGNKERRRIAESSSADRSKPVGPGREQLATRTIGRVSLRSPEQIRRAGVTGFIEP